MARKHSLGHILLTLGTGLLSGALALALMVAVAVAVISTSYQQDLGSKEDLLHLGDRGVILTDRHDQPFFRFYDAQYKRIVALGDISPNVIHALVASEDDRFYEHHGYSLRGIARAAWDNWRSGEIVSGGSTITQQLARTLYLNPQQTYWRKVQELLIAQQLERQFSKDDILELYLNTAYFGAGTYGIEAAAQGYFNTSAKDLDVAQASVLVSVLQAPSLLSPITAGSEPVKHEQTRVLSRMVQLGLLSDEQRAATDAVELHYSKIDEVPLYASQAPHFAFMVLAQLKRQFSEDQLSASGFTVKTTLDLGWQAQTETAVREQVDTVRKQGANNGAAIVLNPRSGAIRALVGSTDWNGADAGRFNVVTAHRQPGSSFKPILYATAIEQHVITAATPLSDRPTTYKVSQDESYKPRNFDGKYRGTVLARRALANSLNIPAVQVMNLLGVDRALDSAEKFGYTSLGDRKRFGLSLALGAGEVSLLEHAGAYAVLANGGQRAAPTGIAEVRDRTNQPVKLTVSTPEQVVSPETAYIVTSMLNDPKTRAEIFGKSLDLAHPAAVKTGTSQDYIDAWTMGYAPDIVVGVWVGHNESKPMQRIAGIQGAAPLWKKLMTQFMDPTVAWYEPPTTLARTDVCRSSGNRATFKGSGVYSEYFLGGTEPTGRCAAPKPPDEEHKDNGQVASGQPATPPGQEKKDQER